MHSFHRFNVLGTAISFRTKSDPALIEEARDIVEERYKELMEKSGGRYGREELLSFLVLGIADELLQTQQSLQEVEDRLDDMLKRIEKHTDFESEDSGSLERA